MKRKIVIGLILFCFIFFVSGYAVITTMEMTSADLNNLLLLHQVEIVREQLLIELKRAQMNLQLKNTPYAPNINVVVDQILELDGVVDTCFECHHAASVSLRLDALKSSIENYKDALSRVLTLSANARLIRQEQDYAYRIGEEIIAEVTNINDLAIRKLRAHTVRALDEGRRTKTIVYGILGGTPVLALFLSALFIRGFTRPVKVLMDATRRLEKGDLDYRIRGLTDEYGEVADSFNRMASSLKQHLEHMQWAEQVVVLGELAGGLAHEIKNPLAGVKASVEVLSQDESITEENREVLVKVAEQVRRMEVLIKSFMSFARPPAPQFTTVNMHSIIDSTLQLAQRHPLFSTKREGRIIVNKEYDPMVPEVSIDPTQFQQVFMNLLLNAAEAMPNGGEISIRTTYDRQNDSMEIRFGDTGKGVDNTLRKNLFQPFFTTKPKGTGLGLSISKRLVEQQGGTIRLESGREGGAVFIITLPLPVAVEVPIP